MAHSQQITMFVTNTNITQSAKKEVFLDKVSFKWYNKENKQKNIGGTNGNY